MPFSAHYRKLHPTLSTVAQPILDSGAEVQAKMIGAVVALHGLSSVFGQVTAEIARESGEGVGFAAGYSDWVQRHGVDSLASYKKLESDLLALGLGDDTARAVLAKVIGILDDLCRSL
jgi:hypothetical protein